MQELESMLTKREMAASFDFDHLRHRVQCYAHIINICSSHVISSMSSVSKQYLSDLKVPTDTDRMFCAEDDDDSDDDNIDTDEAIAELQLDGRYDAHGDPELEEWFACIKHDPLKRARRVIRLLRSSDQCKERFREFIQVRNEWSWFTQIDGDGKRVTVHVPNLQPLRDVKTRWDSVYLMLERLRALRPVSSSQQPDGTTVEANKCLTGYWSVFWNRFAWWLLWLQTVESWLVCPWRVRNGFERESSTWLMDRRSCNDRFLAHFNKACHPNLPQFCRAWSPVSRCLWPTGRDSGEHMRSSGPRRKSACDGQRSIISEWIIQTLMSSWCVSLWTIICCSVTLTSDLIEPVLNPCTRFTWIQDEWECRYIQEAKNIILNLVRL